MVRDAEKRRPDQDRARLRIRLAVSAPGYLDESYELSHDGANPSGSSHTFYLRRAGRIGTGR